MTPIADIMRLSPVIPVLVIEDAGRAEAIARALVAGGLRVLEVTLRTPAALDVITAMRRVPGAVVGAGTVLNAADLEAARGAGAEFIVAPGLTEALGRAAIASGVPFLPGVANAGDIMRGLDMGLCEFKFFPAESRIRHGRANGKVPCWRRAHLETHPSKPVRPARIATAGQAPR